MKKLFTKIGAITLGIALAAGAGVAMSMVAKDAVSVDAASATITASQFTGATNTAIDQTVSNIRFEISNGTTTTEVRVFKGATLTISAPNSYNLKSVEMTCTTSGTAKYGPGCFASIAGYTYSDTKGTWTGESASITLTASTNQVRITQFVITYEQASEKALTSITLSGDYPTVFEQAGVFSHEGLVVTAHYDDESSSDVSANAEFSGYDLGVAGEQTVTVSYTYSEVTKTATYGITVTPVEMFTYEKVTSALTDYSGDYLLVYEGDSSHDVVAFNGSLTALDVIENGRAVTINDDAITVPDAYEFHIAAKTGGYSIQSKSGKYIGADSFDNELLTSDDDSYTVSITIEDGVPSISLTFEGGTVILRFNYAANQLRFRFYKSTSSQQDIALYKKATPTPAATAEAFAEQLLSETSATCAAYVDGVTDYNTQKAALENIWTNLASEFATANLDEVELAKLVNAEGDKEGTTIEQAMARYDFLCAKYGLNQFITGRVVSGAFFAPTSVATNNNTSLALIIIVTSVAVISTAAIVTLIVVRKKRFN